MRGARLVSVTEVEDGIGWALSKIKWVTGGDKIKARFMHQDFFEFIPQFKLLIAGNHKPEFHCVDEAIRRRIVLIPFSTTISEAERDPNLVEKLRAEFPGILNWAIHGCLAWQRDGLKPPDAVVKETENYLASQDALANWLDERCENSRDGWESSGALFANWRSWCDLNGEDSRTQRWFAQQLEAKGLKPERTSRARGFRGIVLRRG